MTITIEKKHLFVALVIIVIAIIGFVCIKSCDKVDYEKTAKEMKINSYAISGIAAQILSDYQKNWRSAISDSRAYNSDGESTYCSDFNTAIGWRFLYFSNEGYFEVLDSLTNVLKEDMKIMDDAPSKYEDLQKTFMSLYTDVNSLVSLTKEPKGSLMTFGTKVNELLMSIENKYKETDIKISVSDEERNEKMNAVKSSLMNRMIESVAKKAAQFEKEHGAYKQENEEFLKENAKKEGVVTLPSGVQYKIIKEGHGRIPSETSLVKVHYEGRDIKGKVFDSSYRRGVAVDLRPNQLIKGWTDALTHMPQGSIWEIYIPQELGYGERDQGSMIKPYSTLIFKVELLKVKD